MLQPAQTKYRKQQKGRLKGTARRGNKVSFGAFGLQARSRGYLSSRQIEAARRAINHYLKRTGTLWIRVFPDKPITKKPLEVRQGKGKGDIDHYAARIKPGTMLYELEGVDMETAREAFRLGSHKLPVSTAFVKRN